MRYAPYLCVIILSIAISVYAIGVIVSSCTDYTPKEYAPPKAVANRDDFPNQINTVCLEGHTYYYTYSTLAGSSIMLAAKLNDDGTPVKCNGEQSHGISKNR